MKIKKQNIDAFFETHAPKGVKTVTETEIKIYKLLAAHGRRPKDFRYLNNGRQLIYPSGTLNLYETEKGVSVYLQNFNDNDRNSFYNILNDNKAPLNFYKLA